jgi:hypothetical protein
MKALFPISASNVRFTSARTANCLASVTEHNDYITFLIADRLQMYNDAANKWPHRDVDEIAKLNSPSKEFYAQRRRWLEKLIRAIGIGANRVETINMDDVCDAPCFSILRNINILYDINDEFRSDINDEVYSYLEKRKSYIDFQRSARLGVHYVLEEIAVNLRVRVSAEIENEYYIGEQLAVLPKLYSGSYNVKISDLTNYNTRDLKFRFFCWREDGTEASWIETTI